jgi:hypothetical protein
MSRASESDIHYFYASMVLAAAALAIGLIVPVGHDQRRIVVIFGICLAGYAAATIAWIWSLRSSGAMHIANLSVWLSAIFLLEFGVAPYLAVFLGTEEADPALLEALVLVIAGSITFWIGCKAVTRRTRGSGFLPCYEWLPGMRLNWVLGLFIVSVFCKLALLYSGTYLYAGDADKYSASLSYVHWLLFLANLSFYAIVMICIEAFQVGKKTFQMTWLLLLAGIDLVFALVSGMKEEVLLVLLLMFVTWRLIRGRAGWAVMLALLVGLIAFYPVNAYYRQELRNEGGATSFSMSASLMARSMNDVAQDYSLEDLLSLGAESTVNRLDLLSTVHFLVNGADTNELKGEEKLWMVPIYAIVPRFVWHSKPILDKGRLLSIAMGAGDQTSTAITPFGDLYILGGVPAVIGGMFLVGMLMQGCSNLILGVYDPKQLFIYMVLFRMCAKPEADMFFYCSALVQDLVIALAIGFMVYGGGLFSFSALPKDDTRRRTRESIGQRGN